MAEQILPSPAVPFVKPDGRIETAWHQCVLLMWNAFNALRTETTAAAEALADDIDDGIDARIATQAELEAASELTTLVPPGLVNFNPGVAKCWGKLDFTGQPAASHNITSVSNSSTGIIDVTIATDFSSADWSALHCVHNNSVAITTTRTDAAQSAGTVRIGGWSTAGAAADFTGVFFAGFGDQ